MEFLLNIIITHDYIFSNQILKLKLMTLIAMNMQIKKIMRTN